MILPNLKSSSLLSMGQICDNGCKVVLAQHDLAVVKNNHIILRGKRNKIDGLWDIPIEKTTILTNNFGHPKVHLAMYEYKNIKKKNNQNVK